MTGYDAWKTTDTAGEESAEMQDRQDENSVQWARDNRDEIESVIDRLETLQDDHVSVTSLSGEVDGTKHEGITSAIYNLRRFWPEKRKKESCQK